MRVFSETTKVWSHIEISEDFKSALEAEIQRRLSPSEMKVRADFTMTCDTSEGINAIKAAVAKGEKYHQEKPELSVNSKY